MSEVVVVALEVVQIEHHDGKGAMFPASGVEFSVQELLHVSAVVKSGERVADGLQQESFPQVEVGDRDGNVFGDGGGKLAAAKKAFGVMVRVGTAGYGIVILDG